MLKGINNKEVSKYNWVQIEPIKGDIRILLNTQMTAMFFSVSSRTLTNWNDKGCPKYNRVWWDIKKVMQWVNTNNDDESLAARKLKAEALYKELQAELKQKELDIKDDEYIAKKEVKEEWVRRVIEVKKGLMALPQRIANQVTDPETRSLLEGVCEDEVRELLEQYARTGKHTPT